MLRPSGLLAAVVAMFLAHGVASAASVLRGGSGLQKVSGGHAAGARAKVLSATEMSQTPGDAPLSLMVNDADPTALAADFLGTRNEDVVHTAICHSNLNNKRFLHCSPLDYETPFYDPYRRFWV